MSDSLQTHGPQHSRPPCPSPTPRVHSNSCPLSRWCHPLLCCPLLLLLSIFPNIRVFLNESALLLRWPLVLPMTIQDRSPLGWTGWISLQSKGLSRVFSNTTVQKQQFFQHSAFFIVQLSHPYMTTGKTIDLTRQTFVGKVMSLLLNMLSRLVITFPRSKHLFISWLQSPSAVILESPKIKSATVSTVSPSIFREVMGSDAMIFVFCMLSFKPTFHSPLSFSSRGFLVPLDRKSVV